MKRIICLCALVLMVFPLAAQTTLSGPVTGYIYEAASRSVRPILGMPGASYISDAVLANVDWAAVAPGGRVALAVRDGAVFAVRGLDAEAAWLPVEGAITPARAAFNREGSAAVLWSSDGRLQFVNLKGAPAAGATAELAGISALALDEAGETALAGTEAGLFAVSADAAPKLVAAGRIAGIALAANGRDLFAADAESGRILEIRDVRNAPAVMPFADAADLAGIALSRDGRMLFAASKSGKTVTGWDVSARTAVFETALDFEPASVEPLSAGSVFLLKAAGQRGEPLQVLNAAGEPGVFFVPDGAAQDPASGAQY